MNERDILRPIPEAFERVTGARIHPTTCWRFCTKGSGGTILKSWMVGSRRRTTIKAVEEFIARRTEVTTPSLGTAKQLADELR